MTTFGNDTPGPRSTNADTVMTDNAGDACETQPESPGQPVRRGVVSSLFHNPIAVTGLVIMTLLALLAVFATVIEPMAPNATHAMAVNAQPGTGGHLLGGDSSGRDILSRVVAGSRVTLLGALLAIAVGVGLGLPSGLVAGYYGGWFDAAASWLANIFLSLPGMVVLLAVVAGVGPSVWITMGAFGVLLSPGIFRLVRAEVMRTRDELYIDAARISGLSDGRIIARHVLSVVRAPVIIQASILAGVAIIVQSGLQFLGVGSSETVTWGEMLNDAFQDIYQAPLNVVWPGLAITLTVAAFALIGNGLRDAIEGVEKSPKTRRRRSRAGGGRQRYQNTDQVGAHSDTSLTDSETTLRIEHLHIGFPQQDGTVFSVVKNLSLGIDRGEVLGLVGESGSGKSQTAFATLGLLPQGGEVLAGDIFINGSSASDMTEKTRRSLLGTSIGYIPQEPMVNLDATFTIGYQLTEPLVAQGMSRSDARAKVLGLLQDVGIADPPQTMRSYPHQVSGGMAQRILIAGAIAGDPDILIADEPTTALDVTVQAEVLALLRRLQHDRYMAILIVTHDFGVVADICDHVAVMQHGRLVEVGDIYEVFDDPQDEYTKMLLNSTLDNAPTRPALARSGATDQDEGSL